MEIAAKLKKTVQRPATYLFVTALVFLVYQVYLMQNSFSALYNIALIAMSRWQTTGSIWSLVWLTSESSGEVGLLLRFIGACLFLTAAWVLLRRRNVSVPVLRKAFFLEATYFLLYIPFVVYLLMRPSGSATGFEAGISYALQILLVSPSLFMLYRKLKGLDQGNDKAQVVRWFTIAFCAYFFALWVKGFLFALYAVRFDFSHPVLIAGSVNSVATLLFAAVGAVMVFLPFFRGRRVDFSRRALGGVLVCAGVYFIIFDLLSLVNANYANWVSLTEWWAAVLLVPGLFLVMRGKSLKKPSG